MSVDTHTDTHAAASAVAGAAEPGAAEPGAAEPGAAEPGARNEPSTDVHAIVDQQLRRTRQRYTLGRRQLVELLQASDRPVTIPELLGHGAVQSQSSLYRNLAILEQCGAVHRIASTDDVARYELTEELSEHHHHVVCSVCGRIDDVVLAPSIERALAEAAQEAKEQRDFEVDSHRLEFVGTCAACDQAGD